MAQPIQWHEASSREKIEVLLIAQDFFQLLKEGEYQLGHSTLHDEVNLGDKWWTNAASALNLLKTIADQKSLSNPSFAVFNFADLEKEPEMKARSLSLRYALDNHSVLVQVEYDKNEMEDRESALFLFKKDPMQVWKLFGFYGFGTKIKINNPDMLDWKAFQKVKFRKQGFSLWMHESFKKDRKTSNRDVNIFSLPLDNVDKAHISVAMMKGLSLPLDKITYYQASKIAEHLPRSEFIIKYLPEGYLYEYELLHENGDFSKVLITAFQRKNHTIIISLISDRDVYQQFHQEMTATFDNVILH
ncbi:MAG: hypothetical protein JJU28_21695 [Cyclobacteriaceae bacterium]|nr:hypothetical protein [Cyclobacteriaceae bacterium]